NFCDRSFHVAKAYQLSIKATTSNIAHVHPTRLGKKTAVPSFCRNCVCTSMNRERATNSKESDGNPQLHLPFTCPPDRPGPTTASEYHSKAEEQATRQASCPETCKDPVCGIFQVHGFENGKADHAQGKSQGSCPSVLTFPGHKGLTKSTHQAEARALENNAKSHSKKQKSSLSSVS